MRVLVIYHNACADGTFAAAVCSLAFSSEQIDFLPLNYGAGGGPTLMADGTPVHQAEGINGYDRVYILDFSLREEELAALTAYYENNLYVFDHHDVRKPTIYSAECEKIGAKPSTNMILANKSSGTLITYVNLVSQFSNSSPRTMAMIGNLMRIVQLVSDYDTWQRKNKRAFAFYAGHSPDVFSEKDELGVISKSMPNTVRKARAVITSGNIEEIIEKGFEAIKQREETFAEMMKVNGVIVEANNHINVPHAVVPASRAIGSNLAQWVQDQNPDVNLVLIVRGTSEVPDRVFVSARSRAGSNISAREIAEKFGGSGHPNSAGFSMAKTIFDSLYPTLELDYRTLGF